jgi:hypothetical protein
MARRTRPRRRPPRRRQRRPRPTLRLIVVSLIVAGALAAAAIAGLVGVARAPDAGPFRFPTPLGDAAAGRRGG